MSQDVLGRLRRAPMSDPTPNDPAVSRRVRLFVIIAVFWFLGANARSSYAINPQPSIGELRSGTLASFDEPEPRPLSPPEKLPIPEVEIPDLPFPALKLPIPAGTGFVPRDGGYTNGHLHLRGDYDQFALDICEGNKCEYDRHVVAPTDIIYDYSTPWSIGYHFFEVYDDGAEKLCMSLGHFDWSRSAFPAGFPEPGTAFPQGAVLGEVSWWGGMPHVHIGIWTMASTTPEGYPTRCHEWTVPRQAQPFAGKYQIDGVELPECWPYWYSCYNVHSGQQLESSNAAYSFLDIERPVDVVGLFYEEKVVQEPDPRLTPTKTGDSPGFFQEI